MHDRDVLTRHSLVLQQTACADMHSQTASHLFPFQGERQRHRERVPARIPASAPAGGRRRGGARRCAAVRRAPPRPPMLRAGQPRLRRPRARPAPRIAAAPRPGRAPATAPGARRPRRRRPGRLPPAGPWPSGRQRTAAGRRPAASAVLAHGSAPRGPHGGRAMHRLHLAMQRPELSVCLIHMVLRSCHTQP